MFFRPKLKIKAHCLTRTLIYFGSSATSTATTHNNNDVKSRNIGNTPFYKAYNWDETQSFGTSHYRSCSRSKFTSCNGVVDHKSAVKSTAALVVPSSSSSRNLKLRRNSRRFATTTDVYFQKHNEIPPPNVMHAQFDNLMKFDSRVAGEGTMTISTNPDNDDDDDDMPQSSKGESQQQYRGAKGILVIGDVHGCLNELKHLIRKSVTDHNDGLPFESIILVGDLCNKGPQSAEVIQFVRTQRHWFTVRGNHDDGALAVALGDVRRGKQRKYSWIYDSDDDDDSRGKDGDERGPCQTLSDDDVEWLANLPYTITIPARYWIGGTSCADDEKLARGLEEDVIIVHAGLIPGIPLKMQQTMTMTTVRELKCVECPERGAEKYIYYEGKKKDQESRAAIKPWGKMWPGPQHIIFGHDAKRGLQINDHSTGLDTGVCYGKQLTGMILPGKTLVSVEAENIHSSPI